MKDQIIAELSSLYNPTESRHLSKFFKTAKGEYGEGDKFLGIRVPVTRSLVRKYKKDITLQDIETLINSEWHEIRLAGFLLLIELYKSSIKEERFKSSESLVKFYITNIDKGNNWDLVDLVAPVLLGDWILRNPEDEKIIIDLAVSENLWHQRVAIVSTFTLIKAGKYNLTLSLAKNFLSHRHDLIHKATGWMLREIGKRGGEKELIEFLEKYKTSMPRTMLRYAIEKFPPSQRHHFLQK